LKIKECPRCDAPGYLEEYCVESGGGERCYYRVVHYYYEGGERRKCSCYVGPVDRYIYVEKLLEMGLTNLLKVDPEVVVERVVEGFIERARSARSRDREKLLEKAKRLRALFSELQQNLAELERELHQAQESK
jgi:hypothetical protein